MVNILGFMGHMVSVAITQLGCYSAKAAIDDLYVNEHGCIPMKLFTDTEITISHNFHITNNPLWGFFQSVKNVKAILSLRAIQTLAAG